MNVLKKLGLILILLIVVFISLPEEITFQGRKIGLPKKINLQFFGNKISKEIKLHLGLDLRGGVRLVFLADKSKVKPEDLEEAFLATRDIIEKRVNFFGLSETSIQTIKSKQEYKIAVDLPGLTDVDQAVSLIGKTAQLSFKEIATSGASFATASGATNVYKETGVTGKSVKKARVTFNQNTGLPEVSLEFTEEGKKLFAEVTKRNVGKPLTIWLDDRILTDPVVKEPILQGQAVISGNFKLNEAKQLAISINSGALPMPIKLVEKKIVGPQLGQQEISLSLYAGIVGLVAVFLFMVLFYGKLGGVAVLALILYGMISLTIFKLIPIVLTLPGVAGFILSIGMAVDANILIFERIKEELRSGKNFDVAFQLGFGRAIDAIKDANLTTIFVALILFNPLNWDFLPQFGLVRGFAVTLMIGVATSLFTGVFITRRMIKYFISRGWQIRL